jgi:hypothetical protein
MAFFVFFSAAILLTSCSNSDGDGGTDTQTQTVPDYGGSIPKGDYVAASIDGNRVTLRNVTLDTEETLSFSDDEGTGSSILKKTEADTQGNFYYMALVEDQVLVMQKANSDGTPLNGELPFYMFKKGIVTRDSAKGRAFNYMEFFADTVAHDSATVELGIVGFDTDDNGRLYGAAFDSDGDGYSITDEDGLDYSGDEFSLALTEEQNDGSLVLWENGIDNWDAATTLTGTTDGVIVLDHGPEAGGGAGFAFPQVTDADPDIFWQTAAGDYFIVGYNDDAGVEFYKCVVYQTIAGGWEGTANVYSLDGSTTPFLTKALVPLNGGCRDDIEVLADFSQAESDMIRDASDGKGLFQENIADPNFVVSFDPDGNYLGIIDLDTTGAFFGIGVKDPNWD